MHSGAMERRTIRPGSLASRRHRTAIALPVIESMIDVPVEVVRSVIPRPGADENAARKPLRTVISVRGAVVRRRFVIAVGTYGRSSNRDADVRRAAANCQKRTAKRQDTK